MLYYFCLEGHDRCRPTRAAPSWLSYASCILPKERVSCHLGLQYILESTPNCSRSLFMTPSYPFQAAIKSALVWFLSRVLVFLSFRFSTTFTAVSCPSWANQKTSIILFLSTVLESILNHCSHLFITPLSPFHATADRGLLGFLFIVLG